MKQMHVAAATVTALVIATVAYVQGYQAADARRYIAPRTKADATLPPFSGAVFAGNTLYLAGEIGTGADNKVPDTAEAEAKAVLDKVQARLKAAGLTMDDLVTVTIFCSDVKHYDAFNQVYRTYFTKEYPARAFIGAGTLLFNARFEVQGIAVRR
jgi:2-iminobutanoate/2-iminopropanoate deaminase